MERRSCRLGCDIGGTFTDFVLLNDQTGEMRIAKCLTTPADPSDAIETGIRQMLEAWPGFVTHLEEIVHGTTLVTRLLADAVARNDRRPLRLLYATRSRREVVDAERLDALRSRLDLTICFLLDERPLAAADKRGPVDVPHIRELLAGTRPEKAVAMLSGPARMMEIAADALLAAGMMPDAIRYERFDFAAGHGQLDRGRRRRALSVFLALLVLMGLFSVRGL